MQSTGIMEQLRQDPSSLHLYQESRVISQPFVYKLHQVLYKLKSTWIKNHHIIPDTLKLIEKKVWKSLEHMGTG